MPTSDVAGPAPVVTLETGPSHDVHVARVPMERTVAWEQWFLLTSDWHMDSILCQRDRLKRVLAACEDRNAYWFAFGDVYDVMGGKWDPRSSKADIRPEYQNAQYLDAVVEDGAKFIKPYAHRGLLITPGNHETSVQRRHETNLSDRLVKETNALAGSNILLGDYQGYVLFRLRDGAFQQTIALWYHHGHGGGGEVTQGTIQAQRRAVVNPDAHIVCSGHIHYRWQTEFARNRLSLKSGRTYQDAQLHLGMSSFKDEFSKGKDYHVESGRSPRVIGGWWLRMFYDPMDQKVLYDAVRTH